RELLSVLETSLVPRFIPWRADYPPSQLLLDMEEIGPFEITCHYHLWFSVPIAE
ncbi:hypothetical protein U1Q18_034260, partial [Sarracenia purpurea var. burkii]